MNDDGGIDTSYSLGAYHFRDLAKIPDNIEKINYVTDVMKRHCMFAHRNFFYRFDYTKMMFRKQKKEKEIMKSAISEYLNGSIGYIRRIPGYSMFFDQFTDQIWFSDICNKGYFGDLNIWISSLTVPDAVNVNFDQDFQALHFKNGRMDLQSNKFSARVPEHLITDCIDYDFVTLEEEENESEELTRFKNEVKAEIVQLRNAMKQIYPEEGVLEYISWYIANYCINGNVARANQELLFLYGEGGTGKSTILGLLKRALGTSMVYSLATTALDNKTLANKAVQGIESTHRILHCNEPNPNGKKNSSTVKSIADGEMSYTIAHRGGNYTKQINATLIITSNWLLDFDSSVIDDTGLNRRILYYRHKNKFVRRDGPLGHTIDNLRVFEAQAWGTEGVVLTHQQKLAVIYLFLTL
jgi:hypothetical protein